MSGEHRDTRRLRDAARAVVEHHFGSRPQRLTRLAGGITNVVYRTDHSKGIFVVRLSDDPVKINGYLKEQWAIARAREAGVPVPEVLEVGNRIGQPYMISRAAAGRPATDHPQRLAIVEELGRIAARIHTVRTNGFGETFDWSQNQLSRAGGWADYLRGHLRIEERVALLTQYEMLSAAKARALRAELSRIAKWTDPPSLNHGDLRLKNLLVDDRGQTTALIDWEFCLSAVAPHWDLSLALHDLSIDQKQALLAGYGLSEDEVRVSARSWAALNLVNYAPFVEQAAAQGNEGQLEAYRTRMNGAFDLYSL